MKKKQIVDFSIAICLIIAGSLLLTFPILKIANVKYVFMGVLTFYGVTNLFQFILTNKEKDYEGLLTMIASIITLILLGYLNVEDFPFNLALTLFVWILLMSLIKLKKCDYYHDRKKNIWVLKIITLLLFILVGLLSVINLYFESSVQIIILGFFYYTHGVLELVDPITIYLIENDK